MSLAPRGALLGEAKYRYHETDIPDYGRIRMRSWTAKVAADFERSYTNENGFDKDKYAERKPIAIILTLVDENDNLLYMDSDREAIKDQDASLVDAIYMACEDHVERKVVTAKNSKETNGDGSQIDSQHAAVGSAE